MKISSASKKVLASALSVAMVVAFAPTVALGAVVEDNGGTTAEEQQPEVTGDTVATVSYVKGSTKYTEQFKSSESVTDDNAVQAAIVYANEIQKAGGAHVIAGATKVTVQLQKDVTVDAVADAQGNVWNPAQKADESGLDEVASQIFIGGDITFDLNGHTISNDANTEVKDGALQGEEFGVFKVVKNSKTFDGGYRTVKAGTAKVTIYAAKKSDVKKGAKDLVKNEVPSNATDIVVSATSSKAYVYNADIEAYVEATAEQIKDGADIVYQFEASYKTEAQYGKGTVAAATANTVITDTAATKGAIKSTNATAVYGEGSITLKDVAVEAKTADGVKADVNGVETTNVDVKGATSVTVNAKASTGSIAAVKATGAVKVYKAKATSSAAAVDGSLTAKADATNLATGKHAAAIEAGTYTAMAETAVDVTATANGASAADGSTGSIIGTGSAGTGQIGDDNGAGSGKATNVAAYAVKASAVEINAGKYSAEYAVANRTAQDAADNTAGTSSTTGSIAYGEFTGHVFGEINADEDHAATNLDVNGGIYSESPKAAPVTVKVSGKDKTWYLENQIDTAADAAHAVATDGKLFYAYKAADASADAWYDNAKVSYNGTVGTPKEIAETMVASSVTGADRVAAVQALAKKIAYISVDEAKNAVKNKVSVADWAVKTVSSLATGKAVEGVELTGTDAAAVQKALIDGNVAVKDGKVSLQVTPKRVDSLSSKLTEAEKTLLNDIDKAADAQSQSVQGTYTLSAQLNQGFDKKDTSKAIKIADVKDMGDTKVAITVRPVSMNSEAQVIYANGTTAGVTMTQAVTNNQAGDASFETSNLNSFGIIYSTTADAIKKADKAAAKVVTDEIAAAAASFATVDSSNYEKALAAVAEIEKDYSKLTDAQKKYVTAEQLEQVAKIKTEAEAVKAAQPAEKKANTVKASKKKMTVKVGKKGTFKVTGAKGKVTVKSSAKKKATASISGKKVTVKGLKKGTATISVKAAGNDAYKAKTVTVKVTVK